MTVLIFLFRVMIVLGLIVILYSRKSRVVEEDLVASLGKIKVRVFFYAIWCFLILNFWQIIGVEYTPFLKVLKYGSIATILGTVILFFSRQDLSNDNAQ